MDVRRKPLTAKSQIKRLYAQEKQPNCAMRSSCAVRAQLKNSFAQTAALK